MKKTFKNTIINLHYLLDTGRLPWKIYFVYIDDSVAVRILKDYISSRGICNHFKG